MRRVKSIRCNMHPSLYDKMEQLRKMYEKQMGKSLSQMEITNMMSKRIKIPKQINLFGGSNEKIVKKKKRSY